MLSINFLLILALILFFIGMAGTIIRRNLLVMLMCMELMLNSIILALAVITHHNNNISGTILSFIIYVVAAAEIALAIPLVLHLVKKQKSLDAENLSGLKG